MTRTDNLIFNEANYASWFTQLRNIINLVVISSMAGNNFDYFFDNSGQNNHRPGKKHFDPYKKIKKAKVFNNFNKLKLTKCPG